MYVLLCRNPTMHNHPYMYKRLSKTHPVNYSKHTAYVRISIHLIVFQCSLMDTLTTYSIT